MAEDQNAAPQGAAEQDAGAAPDAGDPNRATLRLRYDKASTGYANIVFVTGLQGEVILNFGLNAMPPVRQQDINVEISERVVLTYPTAKRLAVTLGNVIRRFEEVNGTIELQTPEAAAAAADQEGQVAQEGQAATS